MTIVADKQFEPEDLKVFEALPADEINTRIQESFVPVAQPTLPQDASDWKRMVNNWHDELASRTFAAWPRDGTPPTLQPVFRCTNRSVQLQAFDFTVQTEITLRLYVLSALGANDNRIVQLRPVGVDDWDQFAANVNAEFSSEIAEPLPLSNLDVVAEPLPIPNAGTAIAWVAPRGIGPTMWNQSEKSKPKFVAVSIC